MSLTGNPLAATVTSKFTAQAGLLKVLEHTVSREKVVPEALQALQTAKARSDLASQTMGKQTIPVETMVGTWSGLHVPPAPTPSDGSTSALEENALPFQQTDVRALPDLVKVNEEDQQRNAKKLKDFQESLRQRHLAATDQFFQLRKTITKELELEVAILGKTLKDKIAGGEAEIAAIVAALSDDKLVNMKLTDIDAQWQRIDMEFEQRNAWILQLSAQLNQIETRRGNLLGAELQRLVGRLTEIASATPADIERLLQQESTDANSHMLRNRASYAELIARLKVVSVQRLNELTQTFAERKAAWRKLRHERALAQYFALVRADDFQKPKQRRLVFDELKKIQSVVHAQCMVKLRGLGETPLAELANGEACKRLTKHVIDLLASISEVADRALAFLDRHRNDLDAQGTSWINAMKAEMAECAYVDAAAVDELISTQCQPEITKVTTFVGSLREKIEAGLQAEEKRIYQPALATIEFVRQTAVMYVAMKVDVDKCDETCTEALNVRSDAYDDEKNNLEGRLATLLKELRGAPDLDQLDLQLQKAHELVGADGLIEQNHRSFNRDSVALASSHVPQLQDVLKQHQALICARFGLNPPVPPPAEGAEEPTAEQVLERELATRVESCAGTVYTERRGLQKLGYTLMTTLSEDEQKEADAKKAALEADPVAKQAAEETAAAAASAQAAAEAEGKLPPPINDVFLPHEGEGELYGVVDSDGLTCAAVLYFDISVAEGMASSLRQCFLDQWETIGHEALELAAAQCNERQTEYARDINQVLRAHRPRIRRVESDVYEPRAVELTANRSKFERHAQRVAQAAYANNAAFHAEVAEVDNELEQYVAALGRAQNALHEATAASAHVTVVQALQKKIKARQAETTEKIKARVEKLNRLCTEQRSKANSAEKNFVDSCTPIPESVLNEAASLANYVPPPPQSRAASRAAGGTTALNGTAELKNGTAELKSANSTGKSEDAKGEESAGSHGASAGTFHAEETSTYASLAAGVTQQIVAVLSERTTQMSALQAKIDATLDMRAFDEDFRAALEDLSVSQSLGHKYGAPKMKVTIRLREEFAASEGAHQAMIDAWQLLQRLCSPASALAASALNLPPRPDSAVDSRAGSAIGGSRASTPGLTARSVTFVSALDSHNPLDDAQSITARLITVLDTLRSTAYRRAVYLHCLKRALPVPPVNAVLDVPDSLKVLLETPPPLISATENLPSGSRPPSAAASAEPVAAAVDKGEAEAVARAAQLATLQSLTQTSPYVITTIVAGGTTTVNSGIALSVPGVKKDDKKAAAPVTSGVNSPANQTAALALYPAAYASLQWVQASELRVTPFFCTIADATAVGRLEMSALFKAYWTANGDRLRAQGRVQTERPPQFDERMLNEEARSKQVHADALASYRQLIEQLGEFVHQVPRMLYNDIFNRTQSAAARASGRIRESFTKIYADSQAARASHQRLLKPSLGAPDARPALEALCAREALRSQRTRDATLQCRRQWLRSARAFAELFLRRIFHGAQAMMTEFDSCTTLVDLDTPELESAAKRKGLKRAMRQHARTSRLTDNNDPSVPNAASAERYLTKTWTGATLNEFLLPELPRLSAQPADEGGDVAAAAAAPAAVPAPAAPAKGKADPKKPEPVAAAAPVAVPAADALVSPPMTGYKIQCNREVIAQRDQIIAAYAAIFQADCATAIEVTLNADKEEEKWTENWLRLIRQLKE